MLRKVSKSPYKHLYEATTIVRMLLLDRIGLKLVFNSLSGEKYAKKIHVDLKLRDVLRTILENVRKMKKESANR